MIERFEPRDPSETPDAEGRIPGRHRDTSPRGFSLRWLGSMPALVTISLSVAILVKTFLLQAFFIPSESMLPTLEIGDRVFVNKLHSTIGEIHRGDIIVFADPAGDGGPDRGFIGGVLHWLGEGLGVAQPADEDFIKRVMGLPGETLEIKGKVLYVDGEPIDEPYLTDEAIADMGDFGPFTVPDGQLFVMGDNRGNSLDSRFGLGTVPIDRVVGDAVFRIWPLGRFGFLR